MSIASHDRDEDSIPIQGKHRCAHMSEIISCNVNRFDSCPFSMCGVVQYSSNEIDEREIKQGLVV
jgi:hypothetical protein